MDDRIWASSWTWMRRFNGCQLRRGFASFWAYCEGMSHGEIAELIKIPVGTVKTNINRGVDKLRTLLSTYRVAGA